MPATINLPDPGEQRITLRHISWETYESLLADHVDASAPRFTYSGGTLEIMSPSSEHEELKEVRRVPELGPQPCAAPLDASCARRFRDTEQHADHARLAASRA
jgi:hypothetical protein